jgi:hypothetical protein
MRAIEIELWLFKIKKALLKKDVGGLSEVAKICRTVSKGKETTRTNEGAGAGGNSV